MHDACKKLNIIYSSLIAAAILAATGCYILVRSRNPVQASKMFNQAKKSVGFVGNGFENPMTTEEALKILNLTRSGLTRAKLSANHGKMILSNHPDKGGSQFLAQKINEAKSILQSELKR